MYVNIANLNFIKLRNNFQAHPYHLVFPSPWPLNNSFNLLSLTSTIVMWMHGFTYVIYFLILSVISLIFSMCLWFKDITVESTYLGNHTLAVQKGINIGFALFIISEAFFFLSIFWTYFHSALSPSIQLGTEWPPKGIEVINPFELPLLNTIILLSSGVSVTYAHHSLIKGNRNWSIYPLFFTIILAIIFTYFQAIEYMVSSFTISDSNFGSCFYLATGFHGLHVIIGTLFLLIGLLRIFFYHFSENHHLGLETSILYWHFVDVVWIFLYLIIYYWGS